MIKNLIISFLIILFVVFCFISFVEIADAAQLTNPLWKVTPQVLIGKVINAILGMVGSIALLMFVYGGFLWLTAGGNPEQIKKGKDVLVWASIGLVVIFTSYALVHFIIKALGV